jgi:hypothetical protein
MATPEANRSREEAGSGQAPAGGSGPVVDAARPDQSRPRGNPEIEQIDVERGLEKIERVSGN